MVSKLQAKVLSLLKELFPSARIKKDYLVKYRGQRLYIDIYVPFLNLAIEVDGKQHEQYNDFFYASFLQYYEAFRRDRLKEEWAKENGLIFLRLKEDEVKHLTKEKLWERIVYARELTGQY